MKFFNLLRRSPIGMRQIEHEDVGDGSLVSAMVDGHQVWFRSYGAKLQPNWTALLAAYFMAARETGRNIRIGGLVSPKVMRQLPRIAELHQQWWGGGMSPTIDAAGFQDPLEPAERRRGLFFSCGMDSFYSLLHGLEAVDDLILVRGFDVKLSENERFETLRIRAQAVASALGKHLIVVETNLREHPLFKKVGWVRSHGSAMASIGHLLSHRINHLQIASSYQSEVLPPWGSHPLIDHLWSSENIKFEHVGDDLWRLEKVCEYGGDPLVQQFLSVCWEGKGEIYNCGVCEKCVRSQLGFLVAGHKIPNTFITAVDLASAISRLTRIVATSSVYTEALVSPHVSEEIKRLIKPLMERGGPSSGAISQKRSNYWDDDTVCSRVKDVDSRKRHEAGSPNADEIKVYSSYLPDADVSRGATAIVLGMTPELRLMAASRFERVVAVDHSAAAIHQYKDWLPDELGAKEKIYSASWSHVAYIDWSVLPPVKAIIGDGIFANLADRESCAELLKMLAKEFPEAKMIFRVPLATVSQMTDEAMLNELRDRFRRDELSLDDFGFSVRMQGFLNRYYDQSTSELDNAAIFKHCERLHAEGFFNEVEIEAIFRFRFNGPNCLLNQEGWERLLQECGFDYHVTQLDGRRWYSYYPIYQIFPRGSEADVVGG